MKENDPQTWVRRVLSKSGAPTVILVAGGILYAEHQALMLAVQELSKAGHQHSDRLMRMETRLEFLSTQVKDVWDFCRSRRWGQWEGEPDSATDRIAVDATKPTNRISNFR